MTGKIAVITCGPAYAPIDSVRRITNFATGEIGTLLAEELSVLGWEVFCLRGEGCTAPPPRAAKVLGFSTNQSLAAVLGTLPAEAAAVFHAAALCDFEVAGISGGDGREKIPSRGGEISLRLRPAEKLLPKLRGFFPNAKILGWKFECDGGREGVLAAAKGQIAGSGTNGCVVNGPAFGVGFGLLLPDGGLREFADKRSLAKALAAMVADS